MATGFTKSGGGDAVRIDLEAREVVRGGVIVRLEPKAAAVLRALIAGDGAPVSRERLLDLCWESDQGSDEALTQAIAQIRRALGDDPAAPRFVVTIPKLGYRWMGDRDQPAPQPETP